MDDLEDGVEVLEVHVVPRGLTGVLRAVGGRMGLPPVRAPGFAGARNTHAAMVGGVGMEGF